MWRKHAGFRIIGKHMSAEISKAYEPKLVEDKWYAEWLSQGHFTANPASSKPPYSIVIPPPNVTGVLTMGHVLNNTLQDILARRKRMQGYEVLWLPGTDHAGIATQTVVEKTLKKQGVLKHRDDLGRDKFLEKVWEWKEKHGGIIIQQLKKLGCSCDWTRERFTMDEDYSQAVLRTFVDLYQKGYIYRGKRMVNWDPAGRTALSDEEVIMTETQGHLWHIKYAVTPLTLTLSRPTGEGQGEGDFVIVATTRPETMLGDEAVAVHPEDPRYQHLIGRKLMLPLQNREILVIADAAVDPKFGTGCVKVTPAHDVADYEMALRHKLPFTVVIGPDGIMTVAGYEGLDRFKCRELVVEQLQAAGALVKVEDYTHNVGYSERTNVPIEPYLSEQWFLRYPQVPRSTAAVDSGTIKFYPERWQKTYTHWMRNIRDWCISRQLWWGHRIPVWYRGEEIYCGLETPTGDGWRQDSDVLDTWFSSWLWPFATMDAATLKKFYPTNDLVTGPDIIFFWVARMIMAGYEYTDSQPFANVYFTGIIRDAQGRKMSKSLGNSPDPLDLIAKYGADGLRFGLMLIAPQGQDILFDEKRSEVGRNFMNKLWNAARFIQMQRGSAGASPSHRNAHDHRVLFELNGAIIKTTAALDEYRFNEAAKVLYDFVWGDFCDWYIEASKVTPNLAVLDEVFQTILRLLHPYAPFITEELWRGMGYGADTIQFALWPKAQTGLSSSPETPALYAIVTAGRQLRNENGVDPKKKVQFVIKPTQHDDFLRQELPFLTQILSAESIAIDRNYTPTGVTPSVVTGAATVFMVGAVDPATEKLRLTKQLADTDKQLAATEAKLANESFVSRAAPVAVEREREKLKTLREQREKVLALLQSL
ncbi:MAG: valine--tRNA ligase [Verrucomicrobiota bacterium]